MELPVEDANALVALPLPLLGLPTEFRDGRNIVSQALACQDTKFNLGNVEPTRMFGGVVDFQAVDQGIGLFRRKHFVEGGRSVGIEVVHHYHDFCNLGVVLFEDLLREERPVLLGALLGHFQ